MPPPTPWLNPPDFLSAARAGVELGLRQREIAQQAADRANELAFRAKEASDHSGVEEQQLANERDRNKAALALANDRLSLGRDRLSTMDENSDASRALREKLGLGQLDLASERFGAQSATANKKADAEQKWAEDYQTAIASGKTPRDAAQYATIANPVMMGTGGGSRVVGSLVTNPKQSKFADLIAGMSGGVGTAAQTNSVATPSPVPPPTQQPASAALLTPRPFSYIGKGGNMGYTGMGPTTDNRVPVPPPSGTINIQRSQTSGTVRVKAPNGQFGTIPAEQLPEALKSGYSRAE